MTPEQLRAAGFNDDEIASYKPIPKFDVSGGDAATVKSLVDAGFNEREIAEHLAKKPQTPTTQATQANQGIVPSLNDWVNSAANFGQNILTAVFSPRKTMQGLADVAAGGFEKYITRPLLGGGQGQQEPMFDAAVNFYQNRYGGGQNIANTVRTDPVGVMADISSIVSPMGGLVAKGGEAANIASLVNTGKTLSTIGEFTNPLSVVTKPFALARQAIGATSIPEQLYARSMKMPPGSVSDPVRANILNTLVREEGIPLSGGSLNNIKATISDLDTGITNTLNSLPQAKFNIDTVSTALDNLKSKYVNRPNAQPYMNAIDNVKQDFINHAYANGGQITVADANQLKKGTYQEIQAYYAKQQRPESGRIGIQNDVDAAAKAEAASVLRNEVLNHPDVPPSVKADMAREAGLMNTRKWVERAVNRGGNLDPVNLSGMLFGVLVEKGIPGAVAYRIATSQRAMSGMAIALANGSTTAKQIGQVSRPLALGAYQAGQIQPSLFDQAVSAYQGGR